MVRLLFVFGALMGFAGVIAYFAAAFIIPEKPVI
ncbi:MAG TPA: PspC domain-containing protein [Bacillota bacterium]|nr:PspC domain-containing protein [Bacillota bacterium]HOK69158.1 PspC domain-containing protein [Bacillota bacterium]HPP84919.1 PspC domain-containing protein [Bacillota bacterium]